VIFRIGLRFAAEVHAICLGGPVEDYNDDKDAEEALAECEKTVEHLKEENARLRESAQTFGDLAERLNAWRRVSNDRWRHPSDPGSPGGKS
jgi:hypothetical protein